MNLAKLKLGENGRTTTIGAIGCQCVLAWTVAMVIYQGRTFLGLGG
jgi:hypothetical protein